MRGEVGYARSVFSEADVRVLLHDRRLASPVASLYLNTDRGHPEGEQYHAGFRHVVQEADEIVRGRRDAAGALARTRLHDALPDIARFLEDEVSPQPVVRGVALFVSLAPPADHDLRTPAFTAFTLPRPLRTHACVERQPAIRPLLFLLDQYERVGVIVADRNHARVFTLFLGEIESAEAWEVDTPRRHHQGGWSQMLFQRDIDGHIQAHIRATVRRALKHFARRPLKRLVFGGSAETLGLLKHELPARFQRELAGEFLAAPHATDTEVVSKALAIAQGAEWREEQARVQELVEALAHRSAAAWGSGESRAVCGLPGTLRALTERRVQRLLLRRGYHAPGAVCENCGALSVNTGGSLYPGCGTPLRGVPDIVEHAVERAIREGALVEFVTESPSLESLGGIGALLRF